jgi:peptide/nickel transport system permease protein
VSPRNPYDSYDAPFSPPSARNWWGTDTLGRDILARSIYGTRYSLTAALVALSISSIAGVPLGLFSGFVGGKIDGFLSLIMDTFYIFPLIILGMLVCLVLGPTLVNLGIAASIGITPSFYRVVRSITLSVKNRTFIETEKSMGAGTRYIIFHHIMPYVLSSATALLSLSVAASIFVVATLGFLGIGIPPPTPEWGTDLGLGRMGVASGIWWPSTFPGAMVFLAVIGFNLLGDSLATILNPRLRRL